MNYNHLCIFDYETSSISPSTTQVLQISALAVNPRTLEIEDEFNSYCKYTDWDTVEPGALAVNHITKEMLDQAPDVKLVWEQFSAWVNRFNRGSTTFSAPIACGYNIINFDLPITHRYCKLYGPYDDKRGCQKMFNQVGVIDLYQLLWYWTENNAEVTKLKLPIMQEYFGFSVGEIEQAHDALADCKACHKILQKLFNASRYLTQTRKETGTARLQFKGCLRTQEDK